MDVQFDLYSHLIRTLGEQLHIEDAEVDAQGYLALNFNSQTVHFQYDDTTHEMVIFTRLGVVEPDYQNDICLALLSANMFWQGTEGATLSMEPSSRMVFLADRQALSLIDIDFLNHWLEGFLHISHHWQLRINLMNQGNDGDIDEPNPQ